MVTIKPKCSYRFQDRSKAVTNLRPHDLSSAVCACNGWACFSTTHEAGFREWSNHISKQMNRKESK